MSQPIAHHGQLHASAHADGGADEILSVLDLAAIPIHSRPKHDYALIPQVSIDPASPADGDIWHNTTDGYLKIRVGGVTRRLMLWDDLINRPSTFPPSAHKDSHKSGGGDAFVLADLLDCLARIDVKKAGTSIGKRRGLNLIEGSNITLTVADDSASEEVDVTIAVAGGADIHSYRRVGATPDRWYCAGLINASALTTGAPTANVLRALPSIVPKTITLDRIAINVTTALAGKARLGIYNDSGVYPASKVIDAGEVDTGTTGAKALTISQTLSPGLYWLVLVGNAAPTIRALALAGCLPILGLGSDLGTAPGVGYSVSFTYAALPATFPSGASVITATPIPAIFVRLSA